VFVFEIMLIFNTGDSDIDYSLCIDVISSLNQYFELPSVL